MYGYKFKMSIKIKRTKSLRSKMIMLDKKAFLHIKNRYGDWIKHNKLPGYIVASILAYSPMVPPHHYNAERFAYSGS